MKNVNQSMVERQFHKNSRKTHYIIGKFNTIPAYIILIIALVLSYLAFVIIKANIENQRNTEFNKAVQSIMTRMENLKQTELGILNSMRGLYDVLPQVTKDYFEIYGTVPLETYKSIRTISFIIELDEINRNNFIFDQYSIGYYYYEIKPPGIREKYYPVQMMVPFKSYEEKLLGYDLKTIEHLAKKIEFSKESKKMTTTDFMNFPFRNGDLSTFVFSPIFHNNAPGISSKISASHFDGVLALEIDVNEFFEEALRGGSAVNKSYFPSDATVFFDIYEKTENDGKNKIFSSKNRNPKYDTKNAEINTQITFKLVDKELEFDFYSDTFIGGFKQKYLPWLILIISLISSFILFEFVRAVIINHKRLEQFAYKVFRSEKSILDNTSELIISANYDGTINLINKEFISTFGIDEDQPGFSMENLIVDWEEKEKFNLALENKDNSTTLSIVLKMQDKHNKEILVEWTIIFLIEDSHINMIGKII